MTALIIRMRKELAGLIGAEIAKVRKQAGLD
jgi:hypothetical protein